MKSPLHTLAILATVLASASCAQTTSERLGLEPPVTVRDFDLDRYVGTWFEIGSYPNQFQEGCANTTAKYVPRDDGEIDVINRCLVDGEETIANGVARPVELDEGKLEVSFFGPFFGDYWIVELGDDGDAETPYSYAVVTSPSRDFLWVLSRTPTLDDEIMDGIFERLAAQGIDGERFVETQQSARP